LDFSLIYKKQALLNPYYITTAITGGLFSCIHYGYNSTVTPCILQRQAELSCPVFGNELLKNSDNSGFHKSISFTKEKKKMKKGKTCRLLAFSLFFIFSF